MALSEIKASFHIFLKSIKKMKPLETILTFVNELLINITICCHGLKEANALERSVLFLFLLRVQKTRISNFEFLSNGKEYK